MEGAEDETTITLQEAIETQEMLESQSVAVLGASDPQNCSYSKGYMKRQALYACLTCNPKGAPFAQPAGVCLACSYTCHEGHELVELFTKRHFRCDCGNKKFPDNPCKLQEGKDDFNVENTYNQNFNGLYCSCHRPYPDPDPDSDFADDTMIQCIICEDWLHFQHCLGYLNTDAESLEAEDLELICGPCMRRLEFLEHYADLVFKPVKRTESETNVEPGNENANAIGVPSEENIPNEVDKKSTDKVDVVDNSSLDSGVELLTESEVSLDGTSKCILKKNPKVSLPFSDSQGIAWKGTLRSSLCRCSDCLAMYETMKIQYLLDEEDTIEHYEALGKKYTEAAQKSAEDSINNQVNSLGRVGQIEFLHGINEFKEKLADFIKSHAESGRVVQREDVADFFAKLNEEQAAKRRRLE